MEVGNYIFIVKFVEKDGKTKVINGVPWMIFNHYLKKFVNGTFNATTATVDKTMAWIRILNLNIVYYDETHESVLWVVAPMVWDQL